MPRPEDGIVAEVDIARKALAKATNATEAKQVSDAARAAEVYARRQKLGEECVSYARKVVVDAMTLMGEMLKAGPKNNGTAGKLPPGPGRGNQKKNGGTVLVPPFSDVPKLSDNGISKRESSDAQALADIKKKAPELHEKIRAGETTVAKARVEVKREEKRAELKAKEKSAPEPTSDDWRIINGDACEELRKLKVHPRLIFADPPYNVGIDYGSGPKADELPAGEFIEWVESWTRLCKDRLAADGSFWLLISDEFAAECCIVGKKYFTLRNWLIWYETFGVNCSNKFNRTKRHLFYFVNDPKRFVFHAEAVTRLSARQVVYNDGRATASGKLWDDLWAIPRLVGTAKERLPDFPTQLPLELLRPIILCATDPGDLILDPFNGSGSTGEAAIENGRRYIGIEKSEHFTKESRKRLKVVTNQ